MTDRRKPNFVPLTVDYFFERSMPEPNSGCWIWLNAVNEVTGYGAMNRGGKAARAHRVAFEVANCVSLPSNIDVCHRCDNRLCVNPDHLFSGTRRVNMQDCREKGRMRLPPVLRGDASPNSKLRSDQVVAIRTDGRSQRAIARAYGVDRGTIASILKGKTWRGVA